MIARRGLFAAIAGGVAAMIAPAFLAPRPRVARQGVFFIEGTRIYAWFDGRWHEDPIYIPVGSPVRIVK